MDNQSQQFKETLINCFNTFTLLDSQNTIIILYCVEKGMSVSNAELSLFVLSTKYRNEMLALVTNQLASFAMKELLDKYTTKVFNKNKLIDLL